jgi:predicted Zn-dependent protease
MTPDVATIEGTHFDGRSACGTPATLIFNASKASLIGAELTQHFPVGALAVSPRIGQANRFIALPDGGQLQCPDTSLLDRFPQEVSSEGIVAWLEQRVIIAIASVFLTIALVASTYVHGLPLVAEHAAARIPLETEVALGDEAVQWLDRNQWFSASRIPATKQALLRTGFAKLCHGLPMQAHYRLEFRNAPRIGPNAFALPGGTIVVTDALIQLAKSPDEVLAVLAHEIGHVERRHTLRNIVQGSLTAVIVATLTADANSLGIAIAGLPALLVQASYSREFETEADTFAFELLKRHDISPDAFARIMERMMKKAGEEERNLGFLSSHPPSPQRIQNARRTAQP